MSRMVFLASCAYPLLEFCQASTRQRCLQFCFYGVSLWFKTKQFWSVPFVSQKKREKYLKVVKKDIRRDYVCQLENSPINILYLTTMKQFLEKYYPILLAFLSLYSVYLWFSYHQLEGIYVGLYPTILGFAIAIRQRRKDG